MTASIRVGPPPARALASASRATWCTATRSLPSTCTPSTPAAIAFCASVAVALCALRGTEIAHWLLLSTTSSGAFHTAAKLSPSSKSPFELPPSPRKHTAARASLRSRKA